MAILKDLIVNGKARHLSDTYLSTVKSGTWNGSVIGVAYGGTGVNSAKGNSSTPVYLASGGITACSGFYPTLPSDAGSSVTKSLVVSSWTDALDISTYDSGTYLIQITHGNVIYSGVFSHAKGQTVSTVQEIPLHHAGSPSIYIYAGISTGKIVLSSASTTAANQTVTIKIKRML